MKNNEQPKQIFLKDYSEPSHWIRKTELSFDIYEEETLVSSCLTIEKNINISGDTLRLDGQDLELLEVTVDGARLDEGSYQVDDDSLTLSGLSGQHVVVIRTKIAPHLNTSLEGLYKSQKMFCTQCEAEGFRKITYYLDRPDVMSEFTTRVCADKHKYPVLLSNGNEIGRGEEVDRHWVEWHDPHLKPCYLFALVAGNLKHIDDHFVTQSGREVLLRIFVEEKDLNKCDHAMRSLKNSMRWDEEVYGREYDLDIFMIVAVDDFNMGAMENKGLNIFNTSCVLANPETTTDAEFQRVEGVVAHEYFHNWSGNRVTCRDWFQLSLKEGFTVFRDAEFSSDMGSRTVKRVEDVSLLRSLQFAEDAGPMAHPVQPASFIEISNFYTLTIYEKGAEIVRMIHSLLGAELFRQGSDLYFEKNDGRAATIEDFVSVMAEVSGRDFSQFMHWYKQAGTPHLKVTSRYDEAQETYTLDFTQSCRPTAETETKQPYVIPVSTSLLGDAGKLPLNIDGKPISTETDDNTQTVIEITKEKQSVTFTGVKEKPVPSLLRGFSAPVTLHYAYSEAELLMIMSKEDDGFCRWDAAQQLSIREIQATMAKLTSDPSPAISTAYIQAFESLLLDEQLDPAMVALMLTLPSEKYLGELAQQIDVDAIHHARNCVARKLAKKLKSQFRSTYDRCADTGEFSVDSDAIARRSLKNTCLHYLALEGSDASLALLEGQFYSATNMTDELAAFRGLVHSGRASFQDAKQKAISHFHDKWKDEALVMNHWFSVQATQPLPQALDEVKGLMQHPSFDFKNPNKLRSLVAAFCTANVSGFHVSSGAGYEFLTEQLLKLNKSNPQIAARFITPFTKWKKYDEKRSAKMKACLEKIRNAEGLSKDVFEVVDKTLNN